MRKKDYIWNTAAGLINAAEAVVMSMVVTRVTNLEDAGILTIAFAVGNLLMTVGKFGVRNYQVTDVEKKFSFEIYLKTRVVTVFFMVAATLFYLLYAFTEIGYDRKKIWGILAVCLIYSVESVEDVVWGYYQSKSKLYVGAEMFCFRWSGILFAFVIILWISRNLSFTLMCCFALSVLIFILLLKSSYPKTCDKDDRTVNLLIKKADWKDITAILKTTFPLFGITFLSFYEHNAPKYAIDVCMTDEVQACYGFVAMPVFIIELLNNFLYQPALVSMTIEWKQGQIRRFRIRIIRQMFIIGGISVVCITGAYLLGIPVLSLLYHTDLSGYKMELMVLLFASVFLAVSGYQSVILTIMRCQKELLMPHCIVSLAAVISLKHIVAAYGTMGAAYSYLFLMMGLCIMYGIILETNLRIHFKRNTG